MYVNMYVVLCVGPAPAGNASQKYCAAGLPSSLSRMCWSVAMRSDVLFCSSGKPLARLPTTQHTPSGFCPCLRHDGYVSASCTAGMRSIP